MPTAIAALLGSGDYIIQGVHKMEWSATISGVGNPLQAAHLPDKTVQLLGPTGGSSQIIIEGTNGDAPSTAIWTILTTPTDGDLDFTNVTGGIIKAIRENPRMIRPRFPAVTAGTILNVIIISR